MLALRPRDDRLPSVGVVHVPFDDGAGLVGQGEDGVERVTVNVGVHHRQRSLTPIPFKSRGFCSRWPRHCHAPPFALSCRPMDDKGDEKGKGQGDLMNEFLPWRLEPFGESNAVAYIAKKGFDFCTHLL